MSGSVSVVLDTNVFVAAGFRTRSQSARLLARIRSGELRLVWDEPTRGETEHVVRKIPPLSWADVADLFHEADRFAGPTDPDAFPFVADPQDRKFAALAAAAGAALVSMDEHLLGVRGLIAGPVLTPAELLSSLPE